MLKDILILFFAPILAGGLVFFVPKVKTTTFKLSLVFAGSYLFSITLLHILPQLFVSTVDPEQIGLYMLLGFFMQLFLEKFSSGIEHGHIHLDEKNHGEISVVFLMTALFLHAFLEGTLLALPNEMHEHGKGSLLLGIALHKMPAAFALTSVLSHQLKNRNSILAYLFVFALASPLGLVLTASFNALDLISDSGFTILFAIVSGNFLHISTTIFIESSPEHRFQANKLFISAVGALFAILAEYFS